MPKKFADPDDIAEHIIRDVGTNLVVGLPLGLGKANHIANALYARAAADRIDQPDLLHRADAGKAEADERAGTALHQSCDRPPVRRLSGSGLCRRAARGCVAAEYRGHRVLLPGRTMAAARRRRSRHYISANYTHASSICWRAALNVVAQLVAKRVVDGDAALQPELQHRHHARSAARPRARRRAAFKLFGQVNSELPFMPGDGDLRPSEFSAVLEARRPIFRCSRRRPSRSRDTQICHRPACGGPRARRRHAADRHRPDRRCAGAGADRASPRQCAISWRSLQRLAPGASSLRRCETGRSKRASTASAKCSSRRFSQLIEAGIIKREVDGALLHARVLPRAESVLSRAARDGGQRPSPASR